MNRKFLIIIPTLNNHNSLSKTLDNIKFQNYDNYHIIIVDSSDKKISILNQKIISKKNLKKISYFYSFIKGTSAQRNQGVCYAKDNNIDYDWLIYLDDDIIFNENFLKKSEKFIEESRIKIFGPLINYGPKKTNILGYLKRTFLFIFNAFQLYSSNPGSVSKSGWQTTHSDNKNLIYKCNWLPSGCLFLKKDLSKYKFDEYFLSYGYLEDLDFTYRINQTHTMIRNNKLEVSTSANNRDSYMFGIKEVINRNYFVKKNKLSLFKYYIMTGTRSFLSILECIFSANILKLHRSVGNIKGLIIILFFDNIINPYKKNRKLKILIDVTHSNHGGGISYLSDLLYYLEKDKIFQIDTISYREVKRFKQLNHKNFNLNSSFNKFYFLTKNYFYYDYILSLSWTFPSKNLIYISQNNISIDEKVLKFFSIFAKVMQKIIRLRLKFLLIFSKIIIAPSLETIKLINQITFYKKKIFLVRNFANIKSDVNRDFLLNKRLRFIYVSNYAPYKNHINLLKCFQELFDEGFKTELICIGKWSFKNYKKKILKFYKENQLHKKNIQLQNEITRDKIYQEYNKSDVFIFASSCEAGSIALIEALNFGLPILSSNKSSMPEYLGEAGMYFNPENYHDIKLCVLNLIKNRKKLLILSKKSRKQSYNFNSKYSANKIISIIKNFESVK